MLKTLRQRFRDARTVSRLCNGAEKHANAGGQRQPGAEHFVLAALELEDGTARQTFTSLGIDSEAFAAAIESQYRAALATVGVADSGEAGLPEAHPTAPPRGPYLAQASAQRLMSVLTGEIMKEAQQGDSSFPLLSAHVLLAASSAKHGVCVRAFEALDLDREQVGRAAQAALRQQAEAERSTA